MSEQRDSSRLRFERRAWCEHQSVTLYLQVSNVSRGGLFLRTSMPLLPGDPLEVSIEGVGGERIVVEVEIVWACRDGRGSGLGCRLLGFKSGAAAYERLVDALERARSQDSASEYAVAVAH
jgi:hypothetical protein